MRANDWKALFKSRGWWLNGQITVRHGQSLTVEFGHNTGTHFTVQAVAGQPEPRVNADESFLIVVGSTARGSFERIYLWEDVSGVNCENLISFYS